MIIDHVAIWVEDLEKAKKEFELLGFMVLPGGQHDSGTQNELIYFMDGSYLELISYPGGSEAYKKVAKKESLTYDWANAPGLVDLCVSKEDATSLNDIFPEADKHCRLISMGRNLVDKNELFELKWQLAIFKSEDDEAKRILPFGILDETLRNYRAFLVRDNFHQNGVLGVADVTYCIHQDEFDSKLKWFEDLVFPNQKQLEKTKTKVVFQLTNLYGYKNKATVTILSSPDAKKGSIYPSSLTLFTKKEMEEKTIFPLSVPLTFKTIE
mmetsp:Transcript_7626/g.11325  ORF Transcript_7626/g.11325 Transcript_7626/m.11325 type:complete len:268 (+) Transcript_7626:28-831(+)|eukprot:CAMPEP_0117426942 /NCGR_PEP_ID=MMETSP0758-20121206/6918_1 /TAXON_ID=63605 /ORGANISM="Percolomonas cosmopolitus, Strain AE-1 (ATCC 50343)" /LENGTH=267 /DNA_ID=CAMNT_0005212339 /DNA_START=14 /DNA_END=817 /DNA_ORIENTATION=+